MKQELTTDSADNSCFVTGAGGFIGQNLVNYLTDSGFCVHALFRSPPKAAKVNSEAITVFKGDILDRESIGQAMEGCSLVFHLAALAKPFSRYPEEFDKINVEGTRNVLETALRNRVRKVVFASTAGVFHPSAHGGHVRETDDTGVVHLTDYSRTKAMAEELCREYAKKGLPVVIVNLSRVFGPGKLTTGNSLSRIIQMYVKGKWHIIPGNGEAMGNYVFIEDVVKGLLLAAESGMPGEKYILGGENLSFGQVFNIIHKESGRSHFLLKLPVPLLKSGVYCLVLISRLVNSEPVITPAWITYYLENRKLSVRKAQEVLGYTVTPFNEGVRKTLDWLKQTNQL